MKINISKIISKFDQSTLNQITALLIFSAVFVLFYPVASFPLLLENLGLRILGGDVFNNIWNFNRNLDRILSFQSPLITNVYFPVAESAYFGELNINDTLIYGIGYLLIGSDVGAYMFLFFIASIFTAFFTYKLATLLGATHYLAIMAGVIAGFCGYSIDNLEHIQLLSVFWSLGILYFTIQYLDTGNKKNLFYMFLFLLLSSDGPSYEFTGLLIMGLVFAAMLYPLYKDAMMRKKLLIVAAVAILALLVNSPIWLGYYEVFADGYYRDTAHQNSYKLDLLNLLTPPNLNNFYATNGSLYNWFAPFNAHVSRFFSGFIALIFVLCSLRIFKINKITLDTQMMHGTIFIKAIFVSASVLLLISLGETITFANIPIIINPVFIIISKLGLLSTTRYIPHFAYPAICLFAIVAAIFISHMKFAKQKKSHYIIIPLMLLMLVEMQPDFNKDYPGRYKTFSSADLKPVPKVYDFLATLEPQAGTMFLPFVPLLDGSNATFNKQFEYMRYARLHSLWLVNGITSFFPAEFLSAIDSFATFPSISAYGWIEQHHPRYIILDKKIPSYQTSIDYQRIIECGSFVQLYQDSEYEVFEIIDAQDLLTNEQCIIPAKSIQLDKIYNMKNHNAQLSPINLIRGWSTPEPWGIWTDGAQSEIFLSIADIDIKEDASYYLYMDANIFKKPDEEKTIRVSINGEFTEPIIFDASQGAQEIKLPIPSAVIANNSTIRVRLFNDNPQSPADIGLSTDARKLGLGLKAIGLIAE